MFQTFGRVTTMQLKKTLFWFLDIMSIPAEVKTVQSKDQALLTLPPKRSSGVIDTRTQIELGALLLILETINLECDYPYLHSLGIKTKTDWNIRKLQHELEKLSDEIESVNL